MWLAALFLRRMSCCLCCCLQEQLNTFNSFVRNTVNSLNQQCGAFNCLNLTSVAPSDRNAMANDNCVSDYALHNHRCRIDAIAGQAVSR